MKPRTVRGIGLEDGRRPPRDLVDILAHPSHQRYVGQPFVLVRREDYVFLVPFPSCPQGGRRGRRRGLALALRAICLGRGYEGAPPDPAVVSMSAVCTLSRPRCISQERQEARIGHESGGSGTNQIV